MLPELGALEQLNPGSKVAVADVSFAQAKETAALHGDKAFAVEVDVTKMASIESAVAAVEARWGGIDILVNGAGVFDLAPIVEVTEASWDKVFAVNAKGMFFTLQAVARRMIARGKGGKIINLSSQAGRRGEALVSVYCASKAAVISLTQSAGLDLIKHHINVNGISPGVADTPMWDHVDSLFAKYEHLPVGEKKRQVGLAVRELDDLLERLALPFGALEQVVAVVDIGEVVLVVMEFERFLRHVRCERVVGVG